MKITLLINGERHQYSSSGLAWLSFQINTLAKSVELNSVGTCNVNYGKGDYNEFEFGNWHEFFEKYRPCVEPALLKYLRR